MECGAPTGFLFASSGGSDSRMRDGGAAALSPIKTCSSSVIEYPLHGVNGWAVRPPLGALSPLVQYATRSCTASRSRLRVQAAGELDSEGGGGFQPPLMLAESISALAAGTQITRNPESSP